MHPRPAALTFEELHNGVTLDVPCCQDDLPAVGEVAPREPQA